DYALTNPSQYNRRINETSIFNLDSLAGHAPAGLVEQNLRLIVGMWNERGDRIGRHNLPNAPMLDPLTGALFAAGAGLALGRLRDRGPRLLLIWLGVTLIPSLFSIETPNAVRTIEAIAPSLLLASIGGCELANWLSRQMRRPLRRTLSAALLLCVAS